VQHGWSNAAASAGKDPCVPPLPGEVYFNSAPRVKDALAVAGLGTMKGKTATVEVDLFSEADTGGPWNVDVVDRSNGTLDLSLDNTSGQNGQKLYLTITVNSQSPNGYAIYQLTSSRGQTQTIWLGIVGYP
jgi:hypothetical protein